MEIKHAEQKALELMKQHGLTEKGWTLKFDHATRRFGQTKYMTKQISLSRPLVSLNDEARVTLTILHEIAHVLAGPNHAHNFIWQQICKQIGGDGKPRYSSETVVAVPARYVAVCHDCATKMEIRRRPSPTAYHTKCRYRENKGRITVSLNERFSQTSPLTK